MALGLVTRGYRLPITTSSAGRITVAWYLGAGILAAGGSGNGPVIARGEASLPGDGYVPLTATAFGRRLIRHTRSLRITAVAEWTASNAPPTTVTDTFTLA